jgi:hypothetical protein
MAIINQILLPTGKAAVLPLLNFLRGKMGFWQLFFY